MQKYIWIVFVIAAVGYFLTYVLAGHYVKGLKDPYEEDLGEDSPLETETDFPLEAEMDVSQETGFSPEVERDVSDEDISI